MLQADQSLQNAHTMNTCKVTKKLTVIQNYHHLVNPTESTLIRPAPPTAQKCTRKMAALYITSRPSIHAVSIIVPVKVLFYALVYNKTDAVW